jgi:S1-C subfamily serine protease
LPRLHAIALGDSTIVRVGDEVFAVGNPFGLDGTVTKGIISAVDRRNVRIGGSVYASLLQTDASISPGSSGGPLVNTRGEVVGVNTAMCAGTGRNDGVGFAVPSAHAREVLDGLIEGGPGILGVWAGTASDPDWRADAAALGWSDTFGAVVSEVIPGTPAERDGVHADDIILAIDGTRIDTKETLANLIAKTKPGTRVELDIWRERQHLTLPVRIGRKYAPRWAVASDDADSVSP